MATLPGIGAFTAALVLSATLAHAEVTSFAVIPSATDPEIKTFNEPHGFY